jgi:hypothetical protein
MAHQTPPRIIKKPIPFTKHKKKTKKNKKKKKREEIAEFQ